MLNENSNLHSSALAGGVRCWSSFLERDPSTDRFQKFRPAVICRTGMLQGRLPILIVVSCGGKVGLPRRRTTERSAFPATLWCHTRWHGPRYDWRSMKPQSVPPRRFWWTDVEKAVRSWTQMAPFYSDFNSRG